MLSWEWKGVLFEYTREVNSSESLYFSARAWLSHNALYANYFCIPTYLLSLASFGYKSTPVKAWLRERRCGGVIVFLNVFAYHLTRRDTLSNNYQINNITSFGSRLTSGIVNDCSFCFPYELIPVFFFLNMKYVSKTQFRNIVEWRINIG